MTGSLWDWVLSSGAGSHAGGDAAPTAALTTVANAGMSLQALMALLRRTPVDNMAPVRGHGLGVADPVA
ncbi:hypothetical protein [Nocardioides sp. SYSU DS0663]|uniref:hypothetical protein n=1 Tax=Nocardioides sp. SYSU DS0663 TaxID=3416445 RepID=UPI003F4B6AEE